MWLVLFGLSCVQTFSTIFTRVDHVKCYSIHFKVKLVVGHRTGCHTKHSKMGNAIVLKFVVKRGSVSLS